MYFKKLEIAGFKSFAEKTTVLFEAGVTAIVGPNGCGKSNVSDAIRWVLGEQSAKSLRGSSMEDVIFNGAADKEPLNFAEVSLTLANETKFLAVDYDEVTLTRRLYRSGESEYLLNKNTVRLKDIHELLLGTGIGTESYSVIEQGKMDLVLNSKPDERRAIFEEAAGITKYKAKKKEALRKLEQTDQNLLRVNDIVQEVKRQISSVERQAKKAELYKIEFEKMKKLELAVAGREFILFDQDRRSKEEELSKLKSEEASCHEAVSVIEADYQKKRAELDGIDGQLGASNAAEVTTQSEIRRTQDRVLLNRERVGELIERRGNISREIESIQTRLIQLRSEYEALERGYAAALAEEKEGQVFLSSAEEEFRRADQNYQDVLKNETDLHRALSEGSARRSKAGAEAAKCRAELAGVGNRVRRIQHEEEALLAEIRQIDERLHLPLFEQGQEQAVSRLDAKILEWREKFMTLIRSWLGRPEREITPQDEAQLESDVRRFADEVGRIQGTMDHREIEQRHQRENKVRLESRLSVFASELSDLANEENSLREKEKELENALLVIDEEERASRSSLSEAQRATQAEQKAKEELLIRLAETRSRQANFTQRREQTEKDKNWILETERGQRSLSESLAREAEESVTKKEGLENENVSLEKDILRLSVERDEIVRALEGLRREREEHVAQLSDLEKDRQEKHKFLQEARERVHGFEMQSAELRFAMDRLKERIFNAYQVDLALDEERQQTEESAADVIGADEPFDLEAAKAEIQKYREKLNRMGPVNLVAIEEHQEMTERYNFLTQQEQDLLKAKEDLHKAILKINRTTKEIFTETFAKIQGYFSEYYKLLFGGGSAELVLLDESDILESGIDIVARPPGKKLQNISLLSGGEKALTAVALVFSLFKVRPSPFCILDEIDAPLDESNVDRFCGVLKEFITASQFILITHNKRTMNLADAIYGITMAQTGISKVVSVKFSGKETKVSVVG